MIEDLPDVPPALVLLARELHASKSWNEMRRRVKGMLRELREQSEAFETGNVSRTSDSRNATRFEVHLDGAMDLMSGKGCLAPECRFVTADRLARSVGLIADRVWLTDLLSGAFIDFGRATNAKIDQVIAHVVVLSRLGPLIRAGVVRFRSPWIPVCTACSTSFEKQVASSAEELGRFFGKEFRIEKRRDGGFNAHTGRCVEPTMVMVCGSTYGGFKRLPRAGEFAKRWVGGELRSALWKAREAALTGGAVFSNSRVGMAGLLKHDGRLVDMRTLLLLDKERDLSVPWVSELDSSQIVQLREEASSALPAFREKMARAMSVSDSSALSSSASSTVVADLREQAAEVRAELDAKRKNSARYWKTTYGLLGLGLSIYGVAADQILPGVGGLLPVLHLLVNHKTGHESDVAKLTTKPGYVLVKAQDILSHADQGQHVPNRVAGGV